VSRVHLAGVIPIAGNDAGIETIFPSVLLPISDGYSAIQKSVYECAMAGCSTIWIVANDDMAPIIRKTIGDWIYDPVYTQRLKFGQGKDGRKEIPIFYTPISPKNIDRRDSYGWSVLSGVYSAWLVGNQMSKWIIPEKYYVSFPMSVYDVEDIRQHRAEIRNPKSNFLLQHNEMTVMDNQLLSFTMLNDDFINCRRYVNRTTTKEFYNTEEGEQYPSKRLPLEERWSARGFSLEQVFSELNVRNATYYSPAWYYNISSWQGYQEYMSSENLFKKPHELLTRPHTHANIPYTLQEGTNESD
jgi:hypothetical protein